MTAHPDDVREALREAGVRLAAADRDRAEAMVDIAAWVGKGHEAGVPIATMADLAGVSRTTVYSLLEP